jgi:hypothetical protein
MRPDPLIVPQGPARLDASDPGFAAAFSALVDARREADPDVSRAVAEIVADVRARGDAGRRRTDAALRSP